MSRIKYESPVEGELQHGVRELTDTMWQRYARSHEEGPSEISQ